MKPGNRISFLKTMAVGLGAVALIPMTGCESSQEAYVRGQKEGYQKGHQEGYGKGLEAGLLAGDKKGYARGYEEGYKDGHLQGSKELFQENLTPTLAGVMVSTLAVISSILMWISLKNKVKTATISLNEQQTKKRLLKTTQQFQDVRHGDMELTEAYAMHDRTLALLEGKLDEEVKRVNHAMLSADRARATEITVVLAKISLKLREIEFNLQGQKISKNRMTEFHRMVNEICENKSISTEDRLVLLEKLEHHFTTQS
jgi:hypothetical protein